MPDFMKYQRTQIAELRPWQPSDDMTTISISKEDLRAGSPKAGDMIARNLTNHADQWLVSAEYFAANFAAIPPATVGSASNARTVNNTVRHQYRVLSDVEKAAMGEIKDIGLAFIEKCNGLGKSRELSIAITNAEQAVMWAVKHITA